MSHYIKAATDMWLAIAIAWQAAIIEWERAQWWRG